MSDQLNHLLRIAVRPSLTLRVVQAALGAHAGMAEFKPVVYLESTTSSLFLEKPDRALRGSRGP